MRTGDGTANWKWEPGSPAETVGNFQVGGIIVGIETIWLIEISSQVLCARIVSAAAAHAYLEFMATVKSNGIE